MRAAVWTEGVKLSRLNLDELKNQVFRLILSKMDKLNILDESTDYEDRVVSFQIGQSRLVVDIRRTKDFYAKLPSISNNCSCDNCKYFEAEVLRQTNRLFTILINMGVDLSRQPDINPDGVSCVGETKPGKVGYMGYYFVYGRIGKTQKKGVKKTNSGQLVEVAFNDAEFGNDTQVTIKQVEEDKLSFDFYMEVQSSQ